MCFLTLYCSVAGLFILFLHLWNVTRKDDGWMWTSFGIQLGFAILLVIGIATASGTEEAETPQDEETGDA